MFTARVVALGSLLATLGGCTFGSTYAPPPFPAQLIRAATGEGRSWHFRTTEPGKPATERLLRFAEVGAEGAAFESVAMVNGASSGAPQRQQVSWEDLEGHAHYAENATVVDDAVVEVPAGRFRCVRYTVKGEGGARMVAWFAATLPGPPVLQVLWRGEREVSRTELLSYTVP